MVLKRPSGKRLGGGDKQTPMTNKPRPTLLLNVCAFLKQKKLKKQNKKNTENIARQCYNGRLARPLKKLLQSYTPCLNSQSAATFAHWFLIMRLLTF